MMTAADFDRIRRTPHLDWPADMADAARDHHLARLSAAAARATDTRARLPELVPQHEYAADPRPRGLAARILRGLNLDRLTYWFGIAFFGFTLGATIDAATESLIRARADIAMAERIYGGR